MNTKVNVSLVSLLANVSLVDTLAAYLAANSSQQLHVEDVESKVTSCVYEATETANALIAERSSRVKTVKKHVLEAFAADPASSHSMKNLSMLVAMGMVKEGRAFSEALTAEVDSVLKSFVSEGLLVSSRGSGTKLAENLRTVEAHTKCLADVTAEVESL